MNLFLISLLFVFACFNAPKTVCCVKYYKNQVTQKQPAYVLQILQSASKLKKRRFNFKGLKGQTCHQII